MKIKKLSYSIFFLLIVSLLFTCGKDEADPVIEIEEKGEVVFFTEKSIKYEDITIEIDNDSPQSVKNIFNENNSSCENAINLKPGNYTFRAISGIHIWENNFNVANKECLKFELTEDAQKTGGISFFTKEKFDCDNITITFDNNEQLTSKAVYNPDGLNDCYQNAKTELKPGEHTFKAVCGMNIWEGVFNITAEQCSTFEITNDNQKTGSISFYTKEKFDCDNVTIIFNNDEQLTSEAVYNPDGLNDCDQDVKKEFKPGEHTFKAVCGETIWEGTFNIAAGECKAFKLTDEYKKNGSISFFTKEKFNCDDVIVTFDNDEQLTSKAIYAQNGLTECDQNSKTELKPGEHTFKAVCGETIWEGSINITAEECHTYELSDKDLTTGSISFFAKDYLKCDEFTIYINDDTNLPIKPIITSTSIECEDGSNSITLAPGNYSFSSSQNSCDNNETIFKGNFEIKKGECQIYEINYTNSRGRIFVQQNDGSLNCEWVTLSIANTQASVKPGGCDNKSNNCANFYLYSPGEYSYTVKCGAIQQKGNVVVKPNETTVIELTENNNSTNKGRVLFATNDDLGCQNLNVNIYSKDNNSQPYTTTQVCYQTDCNSLYTDLPYGEYSYKISCNDKNWTENFTINSEEDKIIRIDSQNDNGGNDDSDDDSDNSDDVDKEEVSSVSFYTKEDLKYGTIRVRTTIGAFFMYKNIIQTSDGANCSDGAFFKIDPGTHRFEATQGLSKWSGTFEVKEGICTKYEIKLEDREVVPGIINVLTNQNFENCINGINFSITNSSNPNRLSGNLKQGEKISFQALKNSNIIYYLTAGCTRIDGSTCKKFISTWSSNFRFVNTEIINYEFTSANQTNTIENISNCGDNDDDDSGDDNGGGDLGGGDSGGGNTGGGNTCWRVEAASKITYGDACGKPSSVRFYYTNNSNKTVNIRYLTVANNGSIIGQGSTGGDVAPGQTRNYHFCGDGVDAVKKVNGRVNYVIYVRDVGTNCEFPTTFKKGSGF